MPTERVPETGLPATTPRAARRLLLVPLALAVSAVLIAACGAPATPTAAPSSVPTAGPAESPAIDHATGSTAVILRFDEGGGFVPPSYFVTQVPYFSLYGDGTVIYRPAAESFLDGDLIGPLRMPALHVATMTEAQIQELLADALVDGGLAVAAPRYENQMVADAPTAVFTVRAGGLDKLVSAYALGMQAAPGPDAQVLAKLATLGERLRAFDQEVAAGRATETGRYAPDRFRATLIEAGGAPPRAPSPWPWSTFGPDSFATPPEGGFPTKVLSGLEAGLVGVDEIAGGASGIWIAAPDGGTAYELALRPLLPDEGG